MAGVCAAAAPAHRTTASASVRRDRIERTVSLGRPFGLDSALDEKSRARRASSASMRRLSSGRRLKSTEALRQSLLSIAGYPATMARGSSELVTPTGPPPRRPCQSSDGRRRTPARRTPRRRRRRCCRRSPLARQQHIPANDDTVADLYEVVVFVPALMRRFSDAGRSTVVLAPSSTSSSMTTVATCGIFRGAVAPAYEAVAIAANHDSVLQNHAIAERDALANRDVRVDDAVGADARPGTDRHVGMHDRAIADDRAFADRYERAERHVCAKLRIRGHSGERCTPDAGRETGATGRPRAQTRGTGRAREAWRTARRAHPLRITAEARVVRRAFSYGIGQERNVACVGRLDSRDRRISTSRHPPPAVEPLGEFAQFTEADCNASSLVRRAKTGQVRCA